MLCVLVKTTGHDLAIPGDHCSLPHPPTFVFDLSLELPLSIPFRDISGIAQIRRNQLGSIFEIIDLGGLELKLIDTNFL